jgi:terminase small subunit / prophage DNA-packing protein
MPKQTTTAGWIVNREELAGILAVAPTTVDRFVRSGCPIIERGKTSQGHRLNTAHVIGWLRERERGAAGDGDGDSSQAAVRRRLTLAQAELAEMKAAERRGQMVAIEDVMPAIAEGLANVRSRLMAMPGRLAVTLALVSDPAQIERAIEDEVRGALTEISQG